MFDRLKFVFSHGKSTTPEVPESVWALTLLLNPGGAKCMTPTDAVAFAKRNADEFAERKLTLYIGGTDELPTVYLFTSQEAACEYVGHLCEDRAERDGDTRVAFGLVHLRRDMLYGLLVPVHNARITLDAGLEDERELDISELQRYVSHRLETPHA